MAAALRNRQASQASGSGDRRGGTAKDKAIRMHEGGLHRVLRAEGRGLETCATQASGDQAAAEEGASLQGQTRCVEALYVPFPRHPLPAMHAARRTSIDRTLTHLPQTHDIL